MKRKHILDLLLKLGKTKEAVAAFLINLGIKGDPRKCRSCPIAQYLIKNGLEKWLGNLIEVGDRSFGMMGGGIAINELWFPLADYPDLRGVRDFISSFDRSEFPDLITSNHQVGCQ